MTVKLREKLIHGGRVLVDEGQGDYVWGHISARLPDNPNRFLMKPGCIGIEEMTEDNIITVDIDGEKIAGDWPRHNEVYIHSEVMRARPDINCVIHTHPEHAIAFSSLGKELQPMSNDGTMFSVGVPIFSETTDLITDQPRGKAVAKCMGQGNVVILRNHGIVTAGTTIEHAVFLAIKLERPAAFRCWRNRPADRSCSSRARNWPPSAAVPTVATRKATPSATWFAAGTCAATARCRRNIARRSITSTAPDTRKASGRSANAARQGRRRSRGSRRRNIYRKF